MNEEKNKIHQPEYIILNGHEEDEREKAQKSSLQGEYMEAFNQLSRKKFSWPLRLFIFMAALIVVIAFIFVFLLTLVSTLLALVTLFMNRELNQTMFKCWRQVRKLIVIFMGLVIGIFSPTLGFGLIILYFMLHGENLRRTFFFNRVFPS